MCAIVRRLPAIPSHPLHACDPSAVRTALEEDRDADSDPLPEGHLDGDFEEALAALLGKDAPGLLASTVARLKEGSTGEHERWQKPDLSARRYVYVSADSIHLQARLEDEKQCILVIIGATPEGKKESIGFTEGARETPMAGANCSSV